MAVAFPIKRAAVVDDDLLSALQALLFDERELELADLPKIEMALRAFITAEELHMLPMVDISLGGKTRHMNDDLNPIGDGVLDYEFVYEPREVALLEPLTTEESQALYDLVEARLDEMCGKRFRTLTEKELTEACEWVSQRLIDLPNRMLSYFRATGDPNFPEGGQWPPGGNYLSDNTFSPAVLIDIQIYAVTLVRLSRGGAVVFSETPIGKACYEHIFSRYPQRIFEDLDASWSAYLRKVIGPGIGISVPPVLACVLTRAGGKRGELSLIIRDLREEYASSRTALWDHLEQMWIAPTLKKQLKLLDELERAAAGLFQASFPERFPFLDTAWDITADVAELRPLSAATKMGKAVLKHSKFHNQVSAISLARQLSGDLRKVAGLARLLRPYLTKSEAAKFGVR